MIQHFIIFGASGNLTARYLLPALAQLHESGKLPSQFEIVGVAPEDWDTQMFRRHISQQLERYASTIASSSRRAVTAMLEYHRADVTDRSQVVRALGPIDAPVVAYLALPPALFAPTVEALAPLNLPEGSRIVIEKPYGEHLASVQALNRLLHKTFPEQAVFRIDHFLGQQTVQNILGLRFANRLFEPLWNSRHVERVEIIWDETRTLEGRAAYYDKTGALRDMLQNHLLQLLCLVGMEPPPTLGEYDLRSRKVDVLRAVHRLSPEEVRRYTVRGRYSAGRIGDQHTPNYGEEAGVDPTRGTETFAQVTLRVNNWRWAGTPFLLRSGKALGRRRREIAIYFRPVPHLAFGQEQKPQANVLRLTLAPDRVILSLNINGVGDPFELERVDLDVELAPQELPAYGRLLLDVLRGEPTFSIRDDEAEESWRIIEPILDTWATGMVPLYEYPAGSDGPRAALAQLRTDS